MLEDPLVAMLDLNRPLTAHVIDLAITYHQAKADEHLANVAALKKAHRLYTVGLPPGAERVPVPAIARERDPPLEEGSGELN